MNLAHSPRCVRRVVKNAVRINHVERIFLEIQILCIRNAKASRQIEKLETLARKLHSSVRQINARVISPCLRELRAVRAQPATYFKHLLPARAREACGLPYVPLLRVAVLLHALVESSRARLRISELSAARVRLPEGTHALFQIFSRTGHYRKNISWWRARSGSNRTRSL